MIDYPTGTQQDNIESGLAKIIERDARKIRLIETKSFFVLGASDHLDAMEYGKSIGAEAYRREENFLFMKYYYYYYRKNKALC